MEFGGITPLGLPEGWPVLVDEAVVAAGDVVVGSGRRDSKLLLPAAALLGLPGARALALAGLKVDPQPRRSATTYDVAAVTPATTRTEGQAPIRLASGWLSPKAPR